MAILFVLEFSCFFFGLCENHDLLVSVACNKFSQLTVLLVFVRDQNNFVLDCVWYLVGISTNQINQ